MSNDLVLRASEAPRRGGFCPQRTLWKAPKLHASKLPKVPEVIPYLFWSPSISSYLSAPSEIVMLDQQHIQRHLILPIRLSRLSRAAIVASKWNGRTIAAAGETKDRTASYHLRFDPACDGTQDSVLDIQ